MATEKDYQNLYERVAALRETLTGRLATDLIESPQLAEALVKRIDDQIDAWVKLEFAATPPPDKGLAELVGLGPEAAVELGNTRLPPGVEPYDEKVTSERLIAVGDLYYLYQHEVIGVFRVVQKLQELFRAGAIRLSAGPGAFALYQFDRRDVLRYTRRDRLAAYRRVLGYGTAPVPPGSRANTDFHNLFTHFVNQVALYWRDKRISDVIRERSYDPSFGSIAVVRRSGMDLRNNLKHTSYGHLNVLRVEVMQLLDEAFRILNADDVKRQSARTTPGTWSRKSSSAISTSGWSRRHANAWASPAGKYCAGWLGRTSCRRNGRRLKRSCWTSPKTPRNG